MATTITYEIDPGGDIELVLNDPNSQRIVPIIKYKSSSDYRNSHYDGYSDAAFDNPFLSGRYAVFNIGDPDDIEEDATMKDNYDKEDASEKCASEITTATANPASDQVTEIRMRVSSRHLILASRTFRAMLEGPWSENSAPTPESGPRSIKTSDWDPAALAIVLDAIHGRYMDIPKDINLGLLARIATIVDYYECHESLCLISEIWLARLRASPMPPTYVYCKANLLWLYISWVFSEQGIASGISQTFLKQSTGLSDICLKDLPLGQILDKIDTRRRELVDRLMTGLDSLRETLSEEAGCPETKDPNCSATMLGILIREQRKMSHRDPPMVSPCNGYSISQLLQRISQFPDPKPPQSAAQNNQGDREKQQWGYERARLNSSILAERQSHKPVVETCQCTFASRLGGVIRSIEREVESFELIVQR